MDLNRISGYLPGKMVFFLMQASKGLEGGECDRRCCCCCSSHAITAASQQDHWGSLPPGARQMMITQHARLVCVFKI